MADNNPPDDATTLSRPLELDAYLTAIQNGDIAEQQRLLARDPQLAAWTECFRQLDSFADSVIDHVQTASATPQNIQFGDYELRGELGRGGMGVVYQAYQATLDRTVALKLLTGSSFATPDQRRRFVQEARLAARIRHPQIVTIHEVGELGGQPYFTMDLIPGTTLAGKLRDGQMPVDQAVRLMIVIAEAVDFLHQSGVLHRDLKPSNILLDAAGQPCLVDFGLARAMDEFQDPTVTGTVLGTPSYMPPEQAAGRVREINERSDVYSLGAIFYEMLCGRPPFSAGSPFDTLLAVLEREPLPLRHWNKSVPRDVERICLRCLEKSPERRYGSVREFVDDLKRWSCGERPAFPSRSPVFQLSRTVRRHPAAAYRLLALMPTMLIVLLRCLFVPGIWDFYAPILAGLGVWMVLSLVWERLSWQPGGPVWTPYAFLLTDIVMLTGVLQTARAADVSHVAAYVLIVLMAALSLNRRQIWVAGWGTIVGYSVLVARSDVAPAWHVPVIVVILLIICTAVTDYQVRRLSIWIRPQLESTPAPSQRVV